MHDLNKNKSRIRNSEAAGYVIRRAVFTGSNLFSEWNQAGDVYAVYSYGYHWPLIAWLDVLDNRNASGWFINIDKYSRTTSAHLTHCRPRGVYGFNPQEVETVADMVQITGDRESQSFNPFPAVGMIAALGNILTPTKEEGNKWKRRMLAAGIPGLDFPEDWDQLTEEEKERRLNGVIEIANEKKEK